MPYGAEPDEMTAKEVASCLGVTVKSVWAYVHGRVRTMKGFLPVRTLNARNKFFPIAGVRAFAAANNIRLKEPLPSEAAQA